MDTLRKRLEQQEERIKRSQIYKAETPHEIKPPIISNYAPEGKFKVNNKNYNKMAYFLNATLDELPETNKTRDLRNLINNYVDLERLRVLQNNIDKLFELVNEKGTDEKPSFLSGMLNLPTAIQQGVIEMIKNPSKTMEHLETARDLFINYVLAFDNFCGRGTDIFGLIEQGKDKIDDKEINNICKTHDLDYYNAQNYNDVLQADYKFVWDYINEYVFGYKKYYQAYEIGDYSSGLAYLLTDAIRIIPDAIFSLYSFQTLYSSIKNIYETIKGLGERKQTKLIEGFEKFRTSPERKESIKQKFINEPAFIYRQTREADELRTPQYVEAVNRILKRDVESPINNQYTPEYIQALTRYYLEELERQPPTETNYKSLIWRGLFGAGYTARNFDRIQALMAGVGIALKGSLEFLFDTLGIKYKFYEARQDEYTQEELEEFLNSINDAFNEILIEQGLMPINLVEEYNTIKDVEIEEKPIEEVEEDIINTYDLIDNKINNREENLIDMIKENPELPELAKKADEERKPEFKKYIEEEEKKQEEEKIPSRYFNLIIEEEEEEEEIPSRYFNLKVEEEEEEEIPIPEPLKEPIKEPIVEQTIEPIIETIQEPKIKEEL